MSRIRIIPRIDIKGRYVIKGIYLEGVRKVGRPAELARRYWLDGADEIILIDAVASLYQRAPLFDVLREAARDVFIPITIGGGLSSLGDIETALKSGAEKVAINTHGVTDPQFLQEAVRTFGSQCIVGSVVVKEVTRERWEIRTDNARNAPGIDALDWIHRLCEWGIGELLLTSVDRDGTKRGVDMPLLSRVAPIVSVPIIIGGGVGGRNDVLAVARRGDVSGVAVASVLHYGVETIQGLKDGILFASAA